MTKELELGKKLAVLGWIFRKGLITEDEYNRTRIHIMGEWMKRLVVRQLWKCDKHDSP